MVIDSHVHMGQFYDQYFSPEYVASLMKMCEVSFYLISSTTTCEDNYDKVAYEFKQLLKTDSNNAIPCLWITEPLLDDSILFNKMLNMYPWKCLKIHPALRSEEWEVNSTAIRKVFKIAEVMKLPLLIHSGEDGSCCADKYEKEIKSYPMVNVILAHGRPIKQTIRMCQKYSNVFTDTAFMSVDSIITLVKSGLSDRVLWGSDLFLPIIYYSKLNPLKYYKKILSELKRKVPESDYKLITVKNAVGLFNLQIDIPSY